MGSLSQATLPQEYQAELDAALLRQPEPQFLHAQLLKNALSVDLGGSILTPPGFIDAGAAYSSAERDRFVLQATPIATEAFAARVDFQRRKGDVVRLNRPKFTNSTYTLASRTIASGKTISTSAQVPDSEQVEIKLLRVGGPYNNDAADITPYGIESFDAQFGLHMKKGIIQTHLQRDFDKFLDSVGVAMCDDGSTTVYPYGMTAVNDATSKGQYPLTYEQITRVSRGMDEADLPKFSTGRRMLTVNPTGKRQLKDDPQFARYAEFHREKNPLFPGWFATCDDFEIFLSNTLGYATSSPGAVKVYNAQAMAPGALGVGMGRAPTVRKSSDDNYQETVRLIWLGDLGFKVFDNRFLVNVKYTEDAA
jgi:hypothetical protein